MEPITNQTKETENVWAKRANFPAVSRVYLTVAVLVCFFCAVSIPFYASEGWALVALAVLFALAAWMVRAPFPLILLLVSVFAAIGLGIRLGVGALFLELVVGGAAFAFLFTVLRQRYLAVLPLGAAAVVAALLLDDPRACVLCFAFLPAALLLAAATLFAKRRTVAICFAAGGFLLTLVTVLALLVYRAHGALNAETLLQFVEDAWRGLYEMNLQIQEQLLAGMPAEDEAVKQMQELLEKARTEEAISAGFAAFSNLLPAYAVIVCSILAFEAQALLNAFYATAGLHCVLDRNARLFTVSLSASVLYALSFLLMLFLPTSGMASAVVQNLCLILLPGLCVLGVIRLRAILFNLQGGARIALLAVVVLLISLAADSALFLLAMWGAYSNLATALHIFMIKKMMGHHNDQNRKDD